MAVLRNGSKCSHTTCMLRFFTVSRLALNPNLIFEIGSNLLMYRSFLKFRNYCDIVKDNIKSLVKLPLSLQRYILLIADKKGSS